MTQLQSVSPDLSQNLPSYKRIAERLKQGILRGDYRPGDALPSFRALAVEERVNPNTARHVYDLLESEGWIEIRHGAGTFVRPPPRPSADERRDALKESLREARLQARREGVTEREWASIHDRVVREFPLSPSHRLGLVAGGR